MLVTNFTAVIKKILKAVCLVYYAQARAGAVPPRELSDPWQQPSFLTTPIDEERRKKHRRASRKAQASKSNHLEKYWESWDRNSSTSSDRNVEYFSSGHQSHLSDLFG